MNEQTRLMRLIQNYSFAVTEAVLYLDTHPHCRQAIRFYDKYRRLYRESVQLYEQKFGPMTMYGNECGDHWQWTEEPWPWEVC